MTTSTPSTMSLQEKFCLRWNDFESNLSAAFKELRQESEYLDVTLLCEDQDQIEAHRVVLSACSGFFRNALRRTKHHHPLLYLKGVQHADLNHILDFIYYGEVSIAQENLNAFLSVAEELKIKGLTQTNLDMKENKGKTKGSQAAAARPRHSSHHEEVEVKHEESSAVVSHVMEGTDLYDDNDDDIQYDEENQYPDIDHSQDPQGIHGAGSQELDTLISTAMYKDPDTREWRCNFCPKSHKDKARITRHVEIHFPGFTQSCPYCFKELPSRNSLRVHISDAHTNVKYARV